MTKTNWRIAAVAVLFIGYAGWSILGLLLAAIGLAIPYWISLRVHPRTRHTGWRGCGGTGEHRGSLLRWGHRRCPGCDGGRMVRWGAGQFGTDDLRTEYARRRAARSAAKHSREKNSAATDAGGSPCL